MNFIKKYNHGLLLVGYAIVYLLCFKYLETRDIPYYHLVHTEADDLIPFCEYFVVPYLLWFPYQLVAIAYFIFQNDNKQEYYQLAKNLMMGMTIFLFVSWVYPNGQNLRPDILPRDNVFSSLVAILYRTDTPTNILPSIHVFNSLAIHMAITNCRRLVGNMKVQVWSFVLTVSIILSTMFLKQHSVVDVVLGATMAYAGYLFFYHSKVSVKARKKIYLHNRG